MSAAHLFLLRFVGTLILIAVAVYLGCAFYAVDWWFGAWPEDIRGAAVGTTGTIGVMASLCVAGVLSDGR